MDNQIINYKMPKRSTAEGERAANNIEASILIAAELIKLKDTLPTLSSASITLGQAIDKCITTIASSAEVDKENE